VKLLLVRGVYDGQSSRMRCRRYPWTVLAVLAVCGLTIGSCSNDGESSATTAISTTGPVVALRDGDTRNFLITVLCGADYLPIGVNDTTWRAEELKTDDQYWVPAEWAAAAKTIDDTSDALQLELRMESGLSRLTATANGRSVSYRPITPDDPPNTCS
jgi:hypothetical protein